MQPEKLEASACGKRLFRLHVSLAPSLFRCWRHREHVDPQPRDRTWQRLTASIVFSWYEAGRDGFWLGTISLPHTVGFRGPNRPSCTRPFVGMICRCLIAGHRGGRLPSRLVVRVDGQRLRSGLGESEDVSMSPLRTEASLSSVSHSPGPGSHLLKMLASQPELDER